MVINRKHVSAWFGFGAALAFVWMVAGAGVLRPTGVEAACSNPPTTYGAVSVTYNIPVAGTYRVWSRIEAPDATNNSFYMQVDGGCPINVGDGVIAANQLLWVDYQNGTSASKIDMTLTAGNHSFVLTGREPGVIVDRVIFSTVASCAPSGNGDNCAIAPTPSPGATPTPTTTGATPTPTPTPTPILVVGTGDGGGGTVPVVSGTVQLPAAPAGSTVQYLVDGQPVSGDSLDTNQLSDGTHTLTEVTTDASGKVSTTAQAIKVQNSPWHKLVAGIQAHPLPYIVGLVLLLGLVGGGIFALIRRKQRVKKLGSTSIDSPAAPFEPRGGDVVPEAQVVYPDKPGDSGPNLS